MSDLIMKLLKELNLDEHFYDRIRLVDPNRKKIFGYMKSNEYEESSSEHCFSCWGNDSVCENCTSMVALDQNKTLGKIEYLNEKIYILTSIPFYYESRQMVIELIKDITDVETIDPDSLKEASLYQLINQRNRFVSTHLLTGSHNEQLIYKRLPFDILESNRKDLNVVLFLVKIKNLDVINNACQYAGGDYILAEIAKLMQKFTRNSNDWTSRFRGTEFILIVHDVNERLVNQIHTEIFDEITQSEFNISGEVVKVAIDIGYYILIKETISPVQFIENARNTLDRNNDVKSRNDIFKTYLFTSREKEVTLLLINGKTNVEIAEELFIGLSTVKKHISSIFSKTDVKSRTEFLARISKL